MTQPGVPEVVVVGASAGALEALSAVLPELPQGYGLPLLVVVHLPAGRESLLAPLLQARCRLTVVEAEDKQPIEPGTAYLAPPDYHLLLGRDRALSLSSEEPVHFSRPSIDVLFETAADALGAGVVGVILSGANSDGSRGLRAICDAGGQALVQRPDQAASAAMPRAALKACPEARALSLGELAECLVRLPKLIAADI
jgi:two-component system chemotaxis response regulator CheB